MRSLTSPALVDMAATHRWSLLVGYGVTDVSQESSGSIGAIGRLSPLSNTITGTYDVAHCMICCHRRPEVPVYQLC